MSFKFTNHRFKPSEISPFLKTSTCIHLPIAKVYFSKSSTHQKFAVISPKHIGSATTRNKCRRWLREIIRLNISQIHPDYNIIIIATKKMQTTAFKTCQDMILLGSLVTPYSFFGGKSIPPWLNGWHRSNRLTEINNPFVVPWSIIALCAYDEQVG